MRPVDVLPEWEVLCALEPEELGLRMLPVLLRWPETHRSVDLSLTQFVTVVVGSHPGYMMQYPAGKNIEIETAIREAWAWLEGEALLIEHYVAPHSIRSLSRQAQKLATEPDAQRAFTARRIPKDGLHPSIREDVWALYHRGRFDTAVFEAMKAVEIAVREAAELAGQDIGTALMRKAFAPDDGALTDMGTDRAERCACSSFCGSDWILQESAVAPKRRFRRSQRGGRNHHVGQPLTSYSRFPSWSAGERPMRCDDSFSGRVRRFAGERALLRC